MLDGGGDQQKIHDLLQRALEIEPRYADAWAAMSWFYNRCRIPDIRHETEFCRRFSVDEAYRLVADALQKALSIDPDNATAIAYVAWNKAFVDYDFAGAARGFERAIELDPNSSDVMRPSIIYAGLTGRPDVAIRLGEYALARDPLCSQCLYSLARSYQQAGRLDEAEATMRNFALATGRGGWNTLAMISLARGDAQGALEAADHIEGNPDDPGRLSARAMALYTLGRDGESRTELERLKALGTRGLDTAAEVHAWRGELDEAYALLEAAVEHDDDSPMLPFDWTRPLLRPLLETERGQALLREFGAADEQLAAIQFNPRLPGEK